MKLLKYFLAVLTALGILLMLAGAAGSHGQFRFRPFMISDWLIFGMPLVGILGLVTLEMRVRRLNSDSFRASIGNKEEFKKLLDLLNQATILLEQANGSNEFLTNLKVSTENLKQFKLDEVENIWTWFAPRAVWDDSVGEVGTDLGNEIFEVAEQLKSQIR